MIRSFDKGVVSPGTAPNEQSVWSRHATFKIGCGARAMVWNHGHGGTALNGILDGNQVPRDAALMAAEQIGMPLLSIDAGGQLWGADIAQLRHKEACDSLDAKGCAPQYVVAGASMGVLLACNFAARNPSRVKALLLAYPLVGLQWWIDNTSGSADAQSAYGTPGSNAGIQNAINATPSYDPVKLARAGLLNGITIRGYVSSNDTSAGGYATWTPFADAIVAAGGRRPTDYNLGPVGHGDDTILPQNDIAAWLGSVA